MAKGERGLGGARRLGEDLALKDKGDLDSNLLDEGSWSKSTFGCRHSGRLLQGQCFRDDELKHLCGNSQMLCYNNPACFDGLPTYDFF